MIILIKSNIYFFYLLFFIMQYNYDIISENKKLIPNFLKK